MVTKLSMINKYQNKHVWNVLPKSCYLFDIFQVMLHHLINYLGWKD